MTTPGYFFPTRAAIQSSADRDYWAKAGSSAPVPGGVAIGDIPVWDGTAYVASPGATQILSIATGALPDPGQTLSVFIGDGAGANSTSGGQVAIGFGGAGADATGSGNVAIGQEAGKNAATQTVSIGFQAGAAGAAAQGAGSIAIGLNAGNSGQAADCIAIGADAVKDGAQGSESIAIGANAGQDGQGDYSVSIGAWNVGTQHQGNECISIGFQAGRDQFSAATAARSIAIGSGAGDSQGDSCIAIGNAAAGYGTGTAPNQGDFSVALGYAVGDSGTLDACTIGIGKQAQLQGADENAIAIGSLAGSGQAAGVPQHPNSLVISAISATVPTPSLAANTCVIKPIGGTYAGAPSSRTLGPQSLFYDGTSGEVTAGVIPPPTYVVATTAGNQMGMVGLIQLNFLGLAGGTGGLTMPGSADINTNCIIMLTGLATNMAAAVGPMSMVQAGTTISFTQYVSINQGAGAFAQYFYQIIPITPP
jgi:hypothetical protein